jgi:hypothetical protein
VEGMALPSLPKKDPRPVPVTVRLSKKAAELIYRNLAGTKLAIFHMNAGRWS